jgi:hypothetical protein
MPEYNTITRLIFKCNIIVTILFKICNNTVTKFITLCDNDAITFILRFMLGTNTVGLLFCLIALLIRLN